MGDEPGAKGGRRNGRGNTRRDACATVAPAQSQSPIAGRQSAGWGVGTSRPHPGRGGYGWRRNGSKICARQEAFRAPPPAPRHLGVLMIQSSDLQLNPSFLSAGGSPAAHPQAVAYWITFRWWPGWRGRGGGRPRPPGGFPEKSPRYCASRKNSLPGGGAVSVLL
jgi:hypothetical protein